MIKMLYTIIFGMLMNGCLIHPSDDISDLFSDVPMDTYKPTIIIIREDPVTYPSQDLKITPPIKPVQIGLNCSEEAWEDTDKNPRNGCEDFVCEDIYGNFGSVLEYKADDKGNCQINKCGSSWLDCDNDIFNGCEKVDVNGNFKCDD